MDGAAVIPPKGCDAQPEAPSSLTEAEPETFSSGDTPLITAEPEFLVAEITSDDEFVLLASDGLWDVVSNQEAVNFVRQMLFQGKGIEKSVKELVKFAIAKGSIDNVSAVLVVLHQEIDV